VCNVLQCYSARTIAVPRNASTGNTSQPVSAPAHNRNTGAPPSRGDWKDTVRSETIPAANRVACKARKATHAGYKWTLGWGDTCRNLESTKVQRNWESVRLALEDFAALGKRKISFPTSFDSRCLFNLACSKCSTNFQRFCRL
jgi:hypothetical protein